MGHDVDDGPLKPVYKVQRPRWSGYFTGRDYNGRVNWWSELDFADSLSKDHKHRLQFYQFRERDPEWYDPPVPKGESVPGFQGEDTRYGSKNPDYKLDTIGNLHEYKKHLMKESSQYKQIAEKFKLSPEHPGIDVSPTLTRLEHTPYRSLGGGSFMSQAAIQWGPRFFDKPLNEGCFEKGLALVKYSSVFSFFTAMAEFKAEYTKEPKMFNYKSFAIRYAKHFPFPAALAFGYGTSICTFATLRNRDDIYNPLYSAAFTGVLAATIKDNIIFGITSALVLSFVGTFWQYMRVSRHGIAGPQYNPMYSSPFWYGPLLYKGVDFGHTEVPGVAERY